MYSRPGTKDSPAVEPKQTRSIWVRMVSPTDTERRKTGFTTMNLCLVHSCFMLHRFLAPSLILKPGRLHVENAHRCRVARLRQRGASIDEEEDVPAESRVLGSVSSRGPPRMEPLPELLLVAAGCTPVRPGQSSTLQTPESATPE